MGQLNKQSRPRVTRCIVKPLLTIAFTKVITEADQLDVRTTQSTETGTYRKGGSIPGDGRMQEYVEGHWDPLFAPEEAPGTYESRQK